MDLNRADKVIGISEAEQARIWEWFEELRGPCSASREIVLAAHLSDALEGFMGIDAEMLSQVFLAKRRDR